MQTVLVYDGSVTNGVADFDLPAVGDQTTPPNNNKHYVLLQSYNLYAAVGVGLDLSKVRLNSPHFRRTFLPSVWPLNSVAAVPSDPSICDLRDRPLSLPALEDIEVDVTHVNAGPQEQTVALFIGDTLEPLPAGSEVYTIPATAAITAVAGAWTVGVLTMGQTLPAGEYAIVGAQVVSATILFARLVVPGQVWRPGFVGCTSLAGRPPWQGRKAPFGVLGRFQSTALPQLEIFCTAADTAQSVNLDLVKIR